jgi:hypothetical protein
MLILPQFRNILFNRQPPLAKLLDVRSDVSDLSTYTFTNVNIGDFGTTRTFDETSAVAMSTSRSPGRKMLAVMVHSEDAAVTWTITSCSIGGVAGTERVDRGGATQAVNSGIYTFTTDILQNITNTDIVVVFSEAVTSCAIGVVSVENMGHHDRINSATNTNASGDMSISPSASLKADLYPILLGCATCAGAETFQVAAENASGITTQCGGNFPELLYDEQNAEMSFAAWWQYSPQYVTPDMPPIRANTNWSGSGAGDVVAVTFA